MILRKKALSVALFTTMAGFSLGANAADQNTANVTLSGLISAVTCDIDVNGVTGGTTVNTGVHEVAEFTSNANNVSGTVVPMVVTLKNCQGDTSIGDNGNLYISGTTANNGNNNIFVGNNSATGFMVLESGGTTAAKALQNHGSVPLNVTVPNGGASYPFNVAMASTLAAPTAGLYTAPIIISYASE